LTVLADLPDNTHDKRSVRGEANGRPFDSGY
jgi:hypothetical protein